MLRKLFAVLTGLVAWLGSQAQTISPAEQHSMEATVIGLFDALSLLDADKAKSFCTNDVSILETGKVWTFDSLASRINTRKALSADFKRINRFNFIDARIYQDAGWLSYFNEATITSSGKTVTVRWLESVVLKKTGADWKIALLHSTELSRTP